jgi:hypothetical protein
MNTTTQKARALWIVINLVCATVASGSTATQLDEAHTNPAPVVVAESQRPLAEAPFSPVEADEDAANEAAPQKTTMRRIRGSEMNVRLARKANEIIREHHKKAYGTNIPFEIDGKSYVGRIERHYHPPGGELRPWGPHPGCSLFVVESAD